MKNLGELVNANMYSLENLCQVIAGKLLENSNQEICKTKLITYLDKYDTKRIVRTKMDLEKILGRIESLIPEDYLYDTEDTGSSLVFIVCRKTKENQLKSFYEDWYFYQEYKDKPNYPDPFYIKYE